LKAKYPPVDFQDYFNLEN